MFENAEYDEAKSAANLRKHGLSFADFERFDTVPTIIVDDRRDYGEERLWAVGRINGLGHVLTFTQRGPTIRLISLRRARDKEMRRYGR